MAAPTIRYTIAPPPIPKRLIERFDQACAVRMAASVMAAAHAYGCVFENGAPVCHGCGRHMSECACTPEILYLADSILTASGVRWVRAVEDPATT